MATTLIVLAHPEPGSFNGAWAEATRTACEAVGDTVLISDLCAMGFDAVESARHYPGWSGGFDPLKAQEAASEAGSLPVDVAAEVAKLRAADRVVFHFPLWWFAPPAVLKGWFDRVLVHGALHGVEARFDAGLCRGKTALFCVTTGATEAESAFDGKEGDVQMLLWPVAYTLRYLGFSVLVPRVVHGVHGYFEGVEEEALRRRLRGVLEAQKDVIARFDDLPRMQFNADDDFDTEGRLKPGRPSYSPFIRHEH